MRTLTSTLLAAQLSESSVPYVEAKVDDYWGQVPRLRQTRYYSGAEAAGWIAAAVAPDGSLVRARLEDTGATSVLYVSRVTSPGSGSTLQQLDVAGGDGERPGGARAVPRGLDVVPGLRGHGRRLDQGAHQQRQRRDLGGCGGGGDGGRRGGRDRRVRQRRGRPAAGVVRGRDCVPLQVHTERVGLAHGLDAVRGLGHRPGGELPAGLGRDRDGHRGHDAGPAGVLAALRRRRQPGLEHVGDAAGGHGGRGRQRRDLRRARGGAGRGLPAVLRGVLRGRRGARSAAVRDAEQVRRLQRRSSGASRSRSTTRATSTASRRRTTAARRCGSRPATVCGIPAFRPTPSWT